MEVTEPQQVVMGISSIIAHHSGAVMAEQRSDFRSALQPAPRPVEHLAWSYHALGKQIPSYFTQFLDNARSLESITVLVR